VLFRSVWHWYHQRNHLREGRQLVSELLDREPCGDPEARIAGLAAQGGLAYWMSDVEAAERAYTERLALAESSGDRVLIADAHYDIGFIGMLRMDGAALRRHEERAVELYETAGDAGGAIRARQALVLAVYLGGDFARAEQLEEQNLIAFRATSSSNEIADSLTFLTAVHMELGQIEIAWTHFREAVGMFAAIENASGLARSLGIAAVLLLRVGQPELAARVAGSAYELVRVHGVMMAPVTVLHLPDPRELAVETLGRERAEDLIATGAATPVGDVIAELMALDVRELVDAPAGSAATAGQGGV